LQNAPLDKPITEVFDNYSNEGYLIQACWCCDLAGLSGDSIEPTIEEALSEAVANIQRPEIWKAIEAV
jgi:hypothetical protein